MTQTAAKPVEEASHAAAAASAGSVDAQPTYAHATQPREGNDGPANVAVVSEGAGGQQSSPGAASPGRGLAPDTAKHVLDLEEQPSAKKQRQ